MMIRCAKHWPWPLSEKKTHFFCRKFGKPGFLGSMIKSRLGNNIWYEQELVLLHVCTTRKLHADLPAHLCICKHVLRYHFDAADLPLRKLVATRHYKVTGFLACCEVSEGSGAAAPIQDKVL